LRTVLTIISTRPTRDREGAERANINPCQDEWKGDGVARPLGAAWDELMAK